MAPASKKKQKVEREPLYFVGIWDISVEAWVEIDDDTAHFGYVIQSLALAKDVGEQMLEDWHGNDGLDLVTRIHNIMTGELIVEGVAGGITWSPLRKAT